MSDYTRLVTSAEVYAVIFARHRENLRAFASFSDPDGRFNGGPGEVGVMETTWGIEGCEWPLLEIRTMWTIDPESSYKRVDEAHQYWLCLPKSDEE